MSDPIRMIVVCTFGAGSSLMLRMNIEAALKEMGHSGVIVEVSDLGSAKQRGASAYIVSTMLADNLTSQNPGAPIIAVRNFYDKKELTDKLAQFFEQNSR